MDLFWMILFLCYNICVSKYSIKQDSFAFKTFQSQISRLCEGDVFDMITFLKSVISFVQGLEKVEHNAERKQIDDEKKLAVYEVIEMVCGITQVMSPSLEQKFQVITGAGKFYVDKEYNTELDELVLSGARRRLKNAKKYGTSEEIEEHEVKVAKAEARLEEGKTLKESSKFNRNSNEVILERVNTVDDVVITIHELGHACMPNKIGVLTETPAIVAEFIGMKIMDSKGITGSTQMQYRRDGLIKRGNSVASLAKLLETFDRNKEIDEKDVERFMNSILCEENDKETTRCEDVVLRNVLKDVEYFLGTVVAFILVDEIKNKYEFEDVFAIFAQQGVPAMQKLKQLGITEEKMLHAVQNAFEKEKMNEFSGEVEVELDS